MSNTALEPKSALPSPEVVQHVLLGGDLSRLTPPQRLAYYRSVCDSLGLNYLTRPFDYIKLSGKEVLYAKREAADQLRKIHGVSIERIEAHLQGDVYTVTAVAKDAAGRTDSEIGAVSVAGLKGESLANAMMKATTKAKRRVTLSICGLGMLDETEVGDAQPLQFDPQTGEIHEPPKTEPAPAPDYITEAQRTRFWTIAKAKGWKTKDDVKAWLEKQGIDSSAHIRKSQYDDIIAGLEMGPPESAAPPAPAPPDDVLDGEELFPGEPK